MAGVKPGEAAIAVHSHDVTINELRPEHGGLVVVQISDLHPSELLGRQWLETRVVQVSALAPDIIVLMLRPRPAPRRGAWPFFSPRSHVPDHRRGGGWRPVISW